MKKQLRVSSYNDYVAIDILDEGNNVLSTPFYLNAKKMGKLIYRDRGVCAVFISDNMHYKLYARDEFMNDFDINFYELLEGDTIEFII